MTLHTLTSSFRMNVFSLLIFFSFSVRLKKALLFPSQREIFFRTSLIFWNVFVSLSSAIFTLVQSVCFPNQLQTQTEYYILNEANYKFRFNFLIFMRGVSNCSLLASTMLTGGTIEFYWNRIVILFSSLANIPQFVASKPR